jgi:hypothetical protein
MERGRTPEKLFPLKKKASSKAPYPVNGPSFHKNARNWMLSFLAPRSSRGSAVPVPLYPLKSGDIHERYNEIRGCSCAPVKEEDPDRV